MYVVWNKLKCIKTDHYLCMMFRILHDKSFFSYASHGRQSRLFFYSIQQFMQTLTTVQILLYDYNIVRGGFLRHSNTIHYDIADGIRIKTKTIFTAYNTTISILFLHIRRNKLPTTVRFRRVFFLTHNNNFSPLFFYKGRLSLPPTVRFRRDTTHKIHISFRICGSTPPSYLALHLLSFIVTQIKNCDA
jgi:hypothetical protein